MGTGDQTNQTVGRNLWRQKFPNRTSIKHQTHNMDCGKHTAERKATKLLRSATAHAMRRDTDRGSPHRARQQAWSGGKRTYQRGWTHTNPKPGRDDPHPQSEKKRNEDNLKARRTCAHTTTLMSTMTTRMPHTCVGARRARSHMVVYFTAVPFDLKKNGDYFSI
jgi:hypothetical protein